MEGNSEISMQYGTFVSKSQSNSYGRLHELFSPCSLIFLTSLIRGPMKAIGRMEVCGGQTSRTKAEPRSYEKTMEEGARERLKRVSVFFPLPPPPSFSSLTSFQLSHGCIPYFTKHKRTHPLETKQNKTAATYAG